MAAFWARYNQALLSKLLLHGERDRLEAEHAHLQVRRLGPLLPIACRALAT